jgi:UDP-N-acetylmuramoyl-L-alanyl-D-glutamate--2,6-diaminopimelate ligase
MVDSGVSHVVMEVSSHGLELERVAGLSFDTSVFTNLSQDHLDFHGSMDSYFAAKAKLFTMTKNAVINIDDTYGNRLFSDISENVSLVTVGAHADVSASNLTTSQNGTTSFDVHKVDEKSHVDLPMLGVFNVSNALCAIVATMQVGISLQDACTALTSFPGVPGRCERVTPSGQALAIVDYAHTPDAVEKILHELRRATQSRLICVLGCGGDRDPSKRYDMGKIAAALSDITVVTDDNPRSEDPQSIRNEVMRGAKTESSELHEIGDRHEAIAYAIHAGKPGDIVAVLGKGHELGQEVKGHIFAFDDREVIRQVSANA